MPARWAGRGRQPTFVGRGPETAAVERAWAGMSEGTRQVVFVGGEPGAGKSRLVAQLSATFYEHGAAVLLGGCVAELGAAYQPFVEPIEALIPAVASGALGLPGGDPPAAQNLLERLATLIGGASPGHGEGPATEYPYDLYDATVAAFRAAAAKSPLVLVLEDLQWAGATSLQLLMYLVERSAGSRILVLATHRSTAPDRSGELVRAMSHLYRLDGVHRVDLRPLTSEDVAIYLIREEGLDPQRARAAGSALRDHTGGNPFFLREMCRDLAARGGAAGIRVSDLHAPESVRDTFEGRLERLEPPQRQILELAAVIGEQFEGALLLAVADQPPDESMGALDAAEQLALVEPAGSDGEFRFPHALARQAVLELMPTVRRARAHARVGEMLEQRFPGAQRRVQRIAHHYAGAHVLGYADKAVCYLIEAAGIAGESLAHREAAALFERAAAITSDGEQRDVLRAAAARGYCLGNDYDRGRELYEQMASTGEMRHRLLAAIGYETASWRTGGTGHRAVELLSAALNNIETDTTDALYVRALASLGRALSSSGAGEKGRVLGHQAVACARSSGDDALLADALQASLGEALRPEDAPGLLERATELAVLAERFRDLEHLGTAAFHRGVVSYQQGDPARLDTARTELARAANATGSGLFTYFIGCVDYGRQFVTGDFAAAQRTCDRLLELGATFGADDTEGPYGVQAFMIRRETGALENIRPLITGKERPTEHWAPGLLALYTELRLTKPAANLLQWLLADDLVPYRDASSWPGVLAFLAEAALWLRDKPAARRVRPLLAEYSGLNLAAGGFDALFGSADRYLASLDSLLGEDPETWFASAMEMDTRMGARLHQAHTLAAWVAHLRDRKGDAGRMEDLTSQARGIAGPLHLYRVLRLLGDARAGEGHTVGLRSAGSPAPSGLSARELEVMRLLGEGLSNREIAERLFITENTAANHVRSILMKTGSGNRTQAAIYAATHGLLG
ncbi:MAG: AAA family ATPase, partial [Actinomycetota bacterium]|nr:AAA family ATPase [Actinomycetota bacterium]